mmetsp:Transcript_54971/g.125128  ORF Transcript_54971/g.125128 Transcript_54971/m.125128 type:complete len:218 (+) Transcript_54971:164-817(+)
MGTEPGMVAAQVKPSTPHMARRPFFSSLSLFASSCAGVAFFMRPHGSMGLVYGLMLPFSSTLLPPTVNLLSVWVMSYHSRRDTKKAIWPIDSAGRPKKASTGFLAATSANEIPCEMESMPGKCVPVMAAHQPANAHMAMRPCLISVKRRRSNLAWSAFSRRLSGSQAAPFTGDDAPISTPSRARTAVARAGRAAGTKAEAAPRVRARIAARNILKIV